MSDLTQRYDDAFALARELHVHDLRKGTEIPYLSHLMAVSALVLEFGGDEDQAIAALLHDAAEDHGGEERLVRIGEQFGPRVREFVAGCSDSLQPEGRAKEDWRTRKERYLARLESKDEDVLLVSLADKIHNARAIAADYRALGETLWERFAPRTRDDQLWYYRSLADVFNRRLYWHRAVRALEEAVRQIEAIAAGEGWIRLTWLERAIADNRRYIEETRAGATEDRHFAVPGSDDWDYAGRELSDTDRAEETLRRLEAEREDFRRSWGIGAP